MSAPEHLHDWLRLTLTQGVGGQSQRALLKAFGPPAQVFAASRAELARVVPEAIAARLAAPPADAAIDRALAWAGEPGNALVPLDDAHYPPPLLDSPDPPCLLYVKGDPARLARPGIAVVGARNATPQGASTARAFSAALAGAGLAVVSGLALGIDSAAHRGALDAGGITIGVVGTGLDRVYPARNRELTHDIAERGVLVSEFALGTPPLAANFPRRNRIIAGLARGVLVVEAAQASGSLITARLAAEIGREVFAIPGSIHSALSKGCHRLIKDGAKLVECVADVLAELGMAGPAVPAPAPAPAEGLLALMGHDPIDVDSLAARSGRAPGELLAELLALELEGKLASLPGGRFQRLA